MTDVSRLAQGEPPDGGVAGFAVDLMERLGGPGAGLAVALENLFPPIPSEVILPLAGFTASQGRMSLLSALAWTTLGSVVGAVILYYAGAVVGRERIRAIAAKLPLVDVADLDRAEAWFARYGAAAVLIGRVVPIVRSLISLPAGVERMPILRFLLYTTVGSLVWNTSLVMAGYLLGESWYAVGAYTGILQKLVIVAAVAAVGWFVVARLRRRRRARAGG